MWKNVKAKCCNCGGDHNVACGGCDVRKRAVEVQKVKIKDNISYAEAVKIIQGEGETMERTGNEGNFVGGQRNLRDISVSMENLILFIEYVINCTDQVRHKTEKIKVIVKGAEKFWSVKHISWEQISRRLESEGKSSSQNGQGYCLLFRGMQEV